MKECFALPNSLQRLTAPDDSRKSAGVMRVIWNERAIPADKSATNRVFLIAKHGRITRLSLTVLSARWEHRRRLRRERAPATAVRTVVAQEPRIGRNARRFAVDSPDAQEAEGRHVHNKKRSADFDDHAGCIATVRPSRSRRQHRWYRER